MLNANYNLREIQKYTELWTRAYYYKNSIYGTIRYFLKIKTLRVEKPDKNVYSSSWGNHPEGRRLKRK